MSPAIDSPTSTAKHERNGTTSLASKTEEEFNPVLLTLKREAEAEIARLRRELEGVNAEEASARALQAKLDEANRSNPQEWVQLISKFEVPTLEQFEMLERKRKTLVDELHKAEAKLELELDTIRKFELSQSAKKGGWLARSKRDTAEFLEAANRILPEYSEKLDRIAKAALVIWHERDKRIGETPELVVPKLEPIHKLALTRIAYELQGLYHTIKPWIDKSSAAVEEGRLSDTQRMELSLHLSELEIKYQTAALILGQLTPK